MSQLSNRLDLCIEEAREFLTTLDVEITSKSKTEGKWSIQEIVGHLIDSAINNYRRFVIGVSASSLVFDGYEQDQWVNVQNYNKFEWLDLIDTWCRMNLLVIEVIRNIPEGTMYKSHNSHNLHLIGFANFSENNAYSLYDLITDYIDHIDHHLLQIQSNYSKE